MYFMQEAGEPLRLKYTKALYGPYAENMRHVLNRIEGHFIVGYGDAGDQPDKAIEPKAEAVERAAAFISEHQDSQTRIERVAKLIDGFETSFGMELLATVHWVASREGASTLDDAMTASYDWGPRKQMFEPDHLELA